MGGPAVGDVDAGGGVVVAMNGPYANLMHVPHDHLDTILTPGVCLDAKSGGWKLSSTSKNTWRSAINSAKKRICCWSVAFVQIYCPVEQYALEVACAMELDTHQFNSFSTHQGSQSSLCMGFDSDGQSARPPISERTFQ